MKCPYCGKETDLKQCPECKAEIPSKKVSEKKPKEENLGKEE
jgi:hypothetical protein